MGSDRADFGTPAAHARIAAGIPAGYRPLRHFAGLLALAALFMAAAAALLRGVRPLEWLMVPAALVFANGFEWVVHRGPLHHPFPPRIAYNRHTLTHHAAFSAGDMAVRSWRELRIVLFPLYALPALQVLIAPVVALLWWALGRNAAALFLLAATFYYVLYEVLHLAYHLPEGHAVARWTLVRRLKAHHQAHHDPALMTAGNYNVSLPLFDWLLGTRVAAQGGAAHSAAAPASGVTHTTS
jgi:hypothetical protein